ncbi:MAG: hypothetical protein ACKV2V_22180, partial [Blastocatellia bacterium]
MTLSDLIIVAGHAIYTADDFDHPERDENWCLQSFQKGEPPFYLEHIRHGIELVAANEKALLYFSGGMTRVEAGRRSEGGSYRLLAEHCGWLSPGIADRVHAEEYARDSFENLLFGLCGFHEITGAWPRQLTVVSW